VYDRWAGAYDGWLSHYERWMGFRAARRRSLSIARGRTLEVGVGTGLNFSLYPPDVRLIGVDRSGPMLELAQRRADKLGLQVELAIGDAQSLDLPDETMDTVVATLVLSVVADDRQTAAEMWRVLRPGGTLLVLDHVRSPLAPVRLVQRLIAPIMVASFGWHFTRDPRDSLASLGFAIEHTRRTRLGMVEELVARKR
jgi:ubiquinone/menaquinone biosynthesis C-methylase UbiE